MAAAFIAKWTNGDGFELVLSRSTWATGRTALVDSIARNAFWWSHGDPTAALQLLWILSALLNEPKRVNRPFSMSANGRTFVIELAKRR